MTQEERISKTLAAIQARIPKNLLANAVKEKKYTPHLERVVDLALNDPDFPEEKKANLRLLKQSGDLARVVPVENPKVTKQIDEFIEREIKKEIKKGNLPPRDQIKNLKHIKELYEKVHNQKA